MAGYETRHTLIQRIRDRMDHASWEEFTSTYKPYIQAIFGHFRIPEDQADDLMQDIFVRVWKSIEKFEYRPEQCQFRSWLSTVCRNVIFSYFEKQKTKAVNLDNVAIPESSPEIDEVIDYEWKLYIANKALANLQKRFEEKVLTAYLEFQNGSSVEDISRELEIAENTVYVYNKRIKAAMSREIITLSNYLE